MLLIGLILFVFLLILFWRVVIWFVGTIGAAKGLEEEYRKYTRSFGIFIAVSTVLFFITDEIYTNMQFKQLCKKEAGLKIYKTVDNVDRFLFLSKYPEIYKLSSYELTETYYKSFSKFNYIEQLRQNNLDDYYIKDYKAKNENNVYKVDFFLLSQGNYGQKDIKEYKSNLLDFSKLNIGVNYFNKDNHTFQLSDNNVIPNSKYAYIDIDYNKIKTPFQFGKSAIVDINDNSIVSENKYFLNYGGKITRIFSWLGSGYGSPIIAGRCGGSGLSYPELINQILQPTVRERNN